MAFQISRSDTGQYVLIDPMTDTVVIDDDLAVGFSKLERAVAGQPRGASEAAAKPGTEAATQGSSVFAFAGGPRYLPALLAVVLPFAWLAVLYFALANLLSEHVLDRGEAKQTHAQLQALEREVQALRSEISGAPRSAKPKPKPKPKPASEPAKAPAAATAPEPGEDRERDTDDAGSDDEQAEPR